MSAPLNRAQMRDAIRRKLQITPPNDLPPTDPNYGPVGAEPAYSPDPSNIALNMFIDEAVDELVAFTGFHTTQNLQVATTATSNNGPQAINLATIQDSTLNYVGAINEIRRIYFDDGVSAQYRLTATAWEDLDRFRRQWQSVQPAYPRQYWIDGYQLWLLPACQQAGTLHIIAGTGLTAYRTDQDTIEQLPGTYQVTIQYCAIRLYAMSKPQDAEAQATLATFGPLAEKWLMKTAAWYGDQTPQHQPSLHVSTYRR